MNRLPLSLRVLIASTLLSTAFIGSSIAPAIAHEHVSPLSHSNLSGSNLRSITKDLAYPTNSQRFLMQGRDLIETEIQQLQRQPPSSRPILNIHSNDPQKQQYQQQPEPRLEESKQKSSNRSPTTKSLIPPKHL